MRLGGGGFCARAGHVNAGLGLSLPRLVPRRRLQTGVSVHTIRCAWQLRAACVLARDVLGHRHGAGVRVHALASVPTVRSRVPLLLCSGSAVLRLRLGRRDRFGLGRAARLC